MKITSVETLIVDAGRCSWNFVRIHTDDGVSGVGEASLEGKAQSVATCVADLSRRLVGEDPARIQHLWQRLFRHSFWRGGVIQMTALSGIEQALWDIKGKVAGLPVHQLLGGACRDRVRLYANGPRGETPEQVAASARAIAEDGFTALKMGPLGPTLPLDGREALRPAVRMVAAVREAVGPAMRIGIDVHGRLSPPMTLEFARLVEPFDIWFLEEPVLPENADALAEVARRSPVPIATGERLFTRWGFREVLKHQSAALWQPDLAHCGGIFEARVIAAMAEINYAGLAPHNPLGPINTMASAQLAMAIPNFVALEYLYDRPGYAHGLVDTPLPIRDGWLSMPDRPGLGVELDEDACRAHPYRPTDQPGWWHEDGAVADW
jgi:galactonate dehydratase